MLAVCILTKNEESFLEGCLKSVIPCADEIIIIDNESTDLTVEIAKKYGCKIYKSRSNNLDEVRNEFFQYTNEPWILSIDADERLSNTCISIKGILKNIKNDDILGLIIPRIDFVGKGCWAYNRMLRIYRNDKRIKYSKVKIHSSLKPAIYNIGGKVGRIDEICIYHIDMLRSDIMSNAKRSLYRMELEQQIKKNISTDEKYNYLCFLGLEYLYIGKEEEAIRVYEEAIKLEVLNKTTAYIFKAQLFFAQKKYDKALEICNFIVNDIFPESDQARYLKTRILEKYGMQDELIKKLLKYITVYPKEVHNYLNLAYMLYLKKENYNGVLEKAFMQNEFLRFSYIYKEGYSSIFSQQIVNLDYSEEFICIMQKKSELASWEYLGN